MKNILIPLVIILFICSLFLDTSSGITLNLAQQVGYITVSGHYEYWDNNGILRPTVWGRVIIYDIDPTGFQRLSDINGNNEWFTDLNGDFDSNPILNYDPEDGGGLDIIVFIITWNQAVQVIDANAIRYNFWVHSENWNNLPDGAHIDFTVQGVPANQIGAWIVFSYHCGIAAGWNYLHSSVSYDMPMATAVWPYNIDYPTYDADNEMIFLPDWAVHPDITLHEYAHYVMNITYGYMPPAVSEYSINGTSDTNTAWVEGWAFFFPLVVQNDPNFIDLNLETPHWCSPNWDDGDKVVGRVAGALWDIYDSQNDSAPWYYDSFSNGFTNIWNIMQTTPCNTFHEFWQAWNTSGYPKQPALMAIFQNSIDYRGPGDVNGDCKCTIADLVLTIGGFGTQKGDPDWDKRRDLNNDDKVTMSDIVIAQANFGNSYDC